MPTGRSIEARIMAALEARLQVNLRNIDPDHGILEPCIVRLDPPDDEPARQLWQVDLFRAGVTAGDADDSVRDHHRLRVDLAIYAPPGDALSDLWWRVVDLVKGTSWWPPEMADIRPLDGGAALREQAAGLRAVQMRTASFELEFHAAQGNAF